MIYRKNATLNLFLLCLLLACSTSLTAATVTWDAGGDGMSWEDPDNWDTNMVPTAADDVIIDGTATVMLSSAGFANSLRINNTAMLTINAAGYLTLDLVSDNGTMVTLANMATLIVDGTLDVLNSPNDAIQTTDNATITNNNTINVTNASCDGVELFNASQWINNGTLSVTDIGCSGIEQEGTSVFTNNGSIMVDGTESEGVEQDDSGIFYNYGSLSINNTSVGDGLCMQDPENRFYNYNMMTISDIADNALEIEAGIFYNEVGATLTFANIDHDAVELQSDGTMENDGTINIDILVDETVDNGFDLLSGTIFRNRGIVYINQSSSMSPAIDLNSSSAQFINEACGLLEITSQNEIELTSGSMFTNEGVFNTPFTGTNTNNGTITNNGVINDPDGFMVAPNAVVGTPGTSQDMAAPTISCPANMMVTTDCMDDLEMVNYTEPAGMDNCNVLSVVCNPPSGSDFMVGTTMVTCTVSDQAGLTATCTFDVTVTQPTIDPPVASVTDKAFCQNADLSPSLTNTGVSVGNTLAADEKVVWVLTSAPAGSAYTAGDEFTTVSCGSGFANFGELAVANTSRTIRVQEPGTAPVGTYTFDAYVYNCTNGCTSSSIGPFSIEVIAAPTVEISADPDGDLCLGQMDVQYDANIMASDGGTYSYMWCAYNSGDGSGTCFNGFDDNTSAMPTRDWTSSAGPKSVGVTVMSEVPGCEAEDLYSFNVVAPTLVECPMDMMGTLVTDDVTFECAATFNWDHPEVLPGPCDPVTLTITISGGSVAVGPDAVTPGTPYSFTFEELGVFTVTYDLVDALGNMSSCSFTITVDGLPCGWVDNGGIGCADNLNSSSYDQGTETFTLTANNCALTGWPYSSDQLAFVFTELCGDGEIVAQVTSIDATGFAGVMMRDSEAPDAPMMAMGTNTINKVLKQVRILPGYPAFPQFVLSYDQFWVRIVRQGNQFMGFASTDGVSWVMYLNQQVFVSNSCLRVGMFTYSEKPGNPITATFDNVSVTEYGSSLVQLPGSTIQSGSSESMLDLEIFPNPTRGIVTVALPNAQSEQPVELHIFNAVGQLIQRKELDATNGLQQTIDLSDQTPGMYFFHLLNADGNTQIEKVILE